jgi:hypothetical protein
MLYNESKHIIILAYQGKANNKKPGLVGRGKAPFERGN